MQNVAEQAVVANAEGPTAIAKGTKRNEVWRSRVRDRTFTQNLFWLRGFPLEPDQTTSHHGQQRDEALHGSLDC